MANTGKVKYTTLYRVSTSGEPLDINGQLCSVSGLPQASKSNTFGTEGYIDYIENNIMCPFPPEDGFYPLKEIVISEDDNVCGSSEIGYPIDLYIENNPGTPIVGNVIKLKNLSGDYVKYNPVNFAELYPSFTYGSYIRIYDELTSKYYSLTMNEPDIIHDGRIIGITDCSSLLINDEETRVYTRNNCSLPQTGTNVNVTIPTGTVTASTEELLAIAVNNWFIDNAQTLANSEGTCEVYNGRIDVWVVTGSPCTGTRTQTTLYISPINDKIYTNIGLTTLFNGTFFTENSILTNYVIVVSGVAQDPINNTCALPTGTTYQDFGTPADISVFGTSLIACYPDKGVVVKYDTSISTNPVGTIVAGELGKTCLGPQSPKNWLNTPMLVEWRDDGERFVVYSGGFYKSLKIFNKAGGFLYEGASMDSFDDEWTYNTPIDPINGKYETPTSNTSLVGLLTARSGALNELWVPTGLEYVSKLGSTFDVIFMPLWSKKSNSENHFKLYAITPTPLIYGYGQSLTSNTINSTGYADNIRPGIDYSGNDLIRGLQVIKKTVINSKSMRIKLAVVAPRTKSKSGNDKYRYYDLSEVEININAIPNIVDPSYDSPQISTQAFNDKGFYRINSNTSGVWKNNVKAELNYTSNTLVVVIKASEVSSWSEIVSAIGISTMYALSGFLLTKVALSIDIGINWGFAPLFFSNPISIAIIAVIAIVAIILLRPPTLKFVGSSALTFTYDGTVDAISVRVYYAGSSLMDSWVNNDIRKPRSVYLDAGSFGNLRLYSLKRDVNTVYYGNWDSNNSDGYILI